MNSSINDYICLLQKYSEKYNLKDKRKLINNKEYIKEGYSIGVVFNQVAVIHYEVYCYVISHHDQMLASSLLMKRFDKLMQASEYFIFLNKYIRNHSIIELLQKCKKKRN